MFQRNGVGLDWSTLFGLSEQEKKVFLSNVGHFSSHCIWEDHARMINVKEVDLQDKAYEEARRISALRFCLEDTTFAQDVLSYEDYQKSLNLFARKQYSSKLLKDLLNKFSCLLVERCNGNDDRINDLLRLEIIRQTNEIRERIAEEAFSPLKKQIEKIAAGVKGICYLEAGNPQRFGNYLIPRITLNGELNKYLKDNFSYDFNMQCQTGCVGSLVLFERWEEQVNQVLQKALLSDAEFWAANKHFNVMGFINLIFKNNDVRHAEKVLHHIFAEIQKHEIGKRILEKSVPLNFLNREKFVEGLEERTFRFAFERFRDESNLNLVQDAKLCFPFVDVENVEEKLSKGKSVTAELFRAIYPEDYKRVLEFLHNEIENPSPVFSEEKETIRDAIDSKRGLQLAIRSTEKWTIRSIFDSHTFGYHTKILDREAVEVYCPEYFSADNIWNRFYLKAYYLSVLIKDKKKSFANLFEIFYDLFQFIEKKIDVRTSYQRNTEGRNKAFEQLKSLLGKKDIQISDNFKEDYVIALLDRKVAIREESERFPILEQLGDAVYGLAVAEMLFYNPNAENISQSFNDFICAQAQIKVAKTIGTDKLYLSSSSLPKKYETDILIDADTEPYARQQESEQYSNKHKYIADSLEMIIGTICKDCGYQKAMVFSKAILKETFPNQFQDEVRWGGNHNSDIDRDYWTRILPAPYSHFDDNLHVLWQAFDKFFKAFVLGTENMDVRRFITQSFGDNALYDEAETYYEVNKVFYEYLHNGIEDAVSKFGESVKEKYQKLN